MPADGLRRLSGAARRRSVVHLPAASSADRRGDRGVEETGRSLGSAARRAPAKHVVAVDREQVARLLLRLGGGLGAVRPDLLALSAEDAKDPELLGALGLEVLEGEVDGVEERLAAEHHSRFLRAVVL